MHDLLPLAVSATAVLLTFLYASWQDFRTRTVLTVTWYPAAGIGGVAVLYFWYRYISGTGSFRTRLHSHQHSCNLPHRLCHDVAVCKSRNVRLGGRKSHDTSRRNRSGHPVRRMDLSVARSFNPRQRWRHRPHRSRSPSDPKHRPQRKSALLAQMLRYAGSGRRPYPTLQVCRRRDYGWRSDLKELPSCRKLHSCTEEKTLPSRSATSASLRKSMPKNWISTGDRAASGSPTVFPS